MDRAGLVGDRWPDPTTDSSTSSYFRQLPNVVVDGAARRGDAGSNMLRTSLAYDDGPDRLSALSKRPAEGAPDAGRPEEGIESRSANGRVPPAGASAVVGLPSAMATASRSGLRAPREIPAGQGGWSLRSPTPAPLRQAPSTASWIEEARLRTRPAGDDRGERPLAGGLRLRKCWRHAEDAFADGSERRGGGVLRVGLPDPLPWTHGQGRRPGSAKRRSASLHRRGDRPPSGCCSRPWAPRRDHLSIALAGPA